MIESEAERAAQDESEPASLEDWARLLRKACKSKFYKQVTEDCIIDVLEKAKAAGFEARDFINLV
jgi:hypothetical protein